MKLTKFKIEFIKSKIKLNDVLLVEAEDFEKAVAILKKVRTDYYDSRNIKSITFESSINTIIIEI